MALTSTTTNMNLILPTPTEQLGPEWAVELNAALTTLDSHDHSSGKGVRVPTSGLNINNHLSFGSNKAYDLKQAQFISTLAAALTGPSNAGSVYMYQNNLYFTNGSGTAIQLTSGAAPVTTPGTFQTMEITSIAGDLTISPSDTFVQINVDTSSSRTITLPLASAVAEGRIYIIADATADSNTNPITIACAGSDTFADGSTSITIDSDGASVWLSGNGVSTFVQI